MAYNQRVVDGLRFAGMAVAEVVFDASSHDGFDIFDTDHAIATAIQQVSNR